MSADDDHIDRVAALPPVREMLAAHGVVAKKTLGQNFLFDLNLTRRIARAGGRLEGVVVYEVGPGPGGLTRALLLEGADRVVAVEPDDRALPLLSDISDASDGRLIVHHGDARAFDPWSHAPAPTRIIANLPYNVGTQLLIQWLSVEPWPPRFDSMVLMFQKEVADRVVAGPGSKTYGRISVLAQWRCAVSRQFDVSPQAFFPPPKITSSVIRLEPKTDAIPCPVWAVEAVTAAAFGQRRKMVRTSLKTLNKQGVQLDLLLERAGLEGTERAEDLSLETFLCLARAVAETASVSEA